MSDQNSGITSLSPPKSSKSTQKIDEAIADATHQTVVTSAIGYWEMFRLMRRQPWLSVVVVYAVVAFSYIAANKRLIVHMLHKPKKGVTLDILQPLLKASWEAHFFGWLGLISFAVFIGLGLYGHHRVTKYRKIFERIRLTNGHNEAPVLLTKRKIDKHREILEFDCKATGLDHFINKTKDLEATFAKAVESIEHGEDQSKVKIILTTHKLPEKVTYAELTKQKQLPGSSFYIGQSIEGIQTQNISELPHMLIAGATGGGKSVFFKQALMGLLESTPQLQLYCIDLKGGLEMADFAPAPNVRVMKDMDDAVGLLAAVEKEMKARFKFLEENGCREIDPKKHKRDRIIISVDESSVLFTALPRTSKDYQNSVRARQLLDSLSKLSRAAAINIILATQKLDKQVLPTQVSENISGRMAFKANSVPGSVQVIYTRDADDLPEIRGRGIWLFGNKKFIVQAPYVDQKEIADFVKKLKEDFREKKRRLQSKMLTIDTKQFADKQTDYLNEEMGIA